MVKLPRVEIVDRSCLALSDEVLRAQEAVDHVVGVEVLAKQSGMLVTASGSSERGFGVFFVDGLTGSTFFTGMRVLLHGIGRRCFQLLDDLREVPTVCGAGEIQDRGTARYKFSFTAYASRCVNRSRGGSYGTRIWIR